MAHNNVNSPTAAQGKEIDCQVMQVESENQVHFVSSANLIKSTHPSKRRLSTVSRQMIEELYPRQYNISPLTILTALYVETFPCVDVLKNLVQERILNHYYRFTSIPYLDPKTNKWIWKQDDGFDMNQHILQHECEETGAYLDSILFNDWKDQDGSWHRPYWNVHLVRCMGQGLSVIVFEIHHCMGDGVSLMRVASRLLDDAEGHPVKWVDTKTTHCKPSLWTRLQFMGRIPHQLCKITATLFKKDSLHVFKQSHAPYVFHKERKVVLFPKIPLSTIKSIKTKAHCTVNDVLASVMAGALYRCLVFLQDPLVMNPTSSKRLRIRAVLPWAYPIHDGDLHNSFSTASVKLPVSSKYATAVSRLERMKYYTQQLKTTGQPILIKHIQSLLTHYGGVRLRGKVALSFFSHQSLVFSNVKGFEHPVYIGGQEIQDMQPIVPNLIHEMTLVSYNGFIRSNIVMEKHVMESITQQHQDKLDSLGLDVYSMLPHFHQLELQELEREYL